METSYLTQYDIKYNKVLLSLFKALLTVIEKHGLQYWTCGGTTLGAVRHNGLIPWDDDIDIYMPRKDYETLINLFPIDNSSPYCVLSPNNKGYFLPYSKFIDRRTTLWEYEEYPFIMGVFIDIFPLDFAKANKKELIRAKRECINNVGKFKLCLNTKNAWNLLIEKHYRAFYYKLFFSHKGNEDYYWQRFQNITKQYSSNSGWAATCWSQAPGKLFLSQWFEEYELIQFEDFQVRIPKGYHDYLTYRYGNYMQLPSQDKRVSNHERYYINLEESLTLEVVKDRIKHGERQK